MHPLWPCQLFRLASVLFLNFPGGSNGKASAYNAGDPSLIPGLGRSSGEGGVNPHQYSCLENPMDGSFTGWSSERCPGIGFLSRGDREIGVIRNVEAPTRPRLECRREPGLILRCDRKVGNPFQTKQGSRPSCRDQDGRRGSEEVVPENLGVPLQGDRDAGELCRGASRVPSTVSTSNS